MTKRWCISVLAFLLAFSGAVIAPTLLDQTPNAAAAPGCPDVEVIFARGTIEPAPPVGLTGLAFTESLRNRLPGKSVRVYGVNYPASDQFNDRLRFAHTVRDGVIDAQNRVKYIARVCPRTAIVLGGYSQGAVLVGYAVQDKLDIPTGYERYARYAPSPLPAAIAPRITAVVMFGAPSDRFIRDVGAPPIRVAPAFRGKTVRYCIPGDTICNGSPVGGPNALHVLYTVNGMTFSAADFVVRRL